MWVYEQSTGNLVSPSALLEGVGYSGHGNGVNNPTMQEVHDVGPCPAGIWAMSEFFDDPEGKGPMVCRLTPAPGTEAFGRAGFMIHGDTVAHDMTASHGCIILTRPLREMLAASADRVLKVIP